MYRLCTEEREHTLYKKRFLLGHFSIWFIFVNVIWYVVCYLHLMEGGDGLGTDMERAAFLVGFVVMWVVVVLVDATSYRWYIKSLFILVAALTALRRATYYVDAEPVYLFNLTGLKYDIYGGMRSSALTLFLYSSKDMRNALMFRSRRLTHVRAVLGRDLRMGSYSDRKRSIAQKFAEIRAMERELIADESKDNLADLQPTGRFSSFRSSLTALKLLQPTEPSLDNGPGLEQVLELSASRPEQRLQSSVALGSSIRHSIQERLTYL